MVGKCYRKKKLLEGFYLYCKFFSFVIIFYVYKDFKEYFMWIWFLDIGYLYVVVFMNLMLVWFICYLFLVVRCYMFWCYWK